MSGKRVRIEFREITNGRLQEAKKEGKKRACMETE